MDMLVKSWIFGTISPELQDVTHQRGLTARVAWLAMENRFIGNQETHALHIEATFWNFVQGNLNVNNYCLKMKGFADSLIDLGVDVPDRVLVLNVLRGLSKNFDHFRAIFTHTTSFPSFQKVHDDMCLEEIQLGAAVCHCYPHCVLHRAQATIGANFFQWACAPPTAAATAAPAAAVRQEEQPW
jgi:hypothetical protein